MNYTLIYIKTKNALNPFMGFVQEFPFIRIYGRTLIETQNKLHYQVYIERLYRQRVMRRKIRKYHAMLNTPQFKDRKNDFIWKRLFAQSQPMLKHMADEALADFRAGRTTPINDLFD